MTRSPRFHSVFLCAVLVFLCWTGLGAQNLQLRQESVIGFPIDWVVEIVPYVLPGEGHHRVAVLNQHYVLGLEWSPRHGAYEQSFFIQRSAHYEGRRELFVAEANGDGVDDLLLVGEETMAVYDSRTGSFLRSIPLSTSITSAAAQDVDGVSGRELLVTEGNRQEIGVSAYAAGERLWHSVVRNAHRVIPVGTTTNDEVFVATADDVVALDARTGAERRRLPLAGGGHTAGQTDLDASSEMAYVRSAGFGTVIVAVVDATTGVEQWSRRMDTVQRLMMIDANGDGVQDVVVTKFGSVAVLNGADGAPLTPGIFAAGRFFQESGPVAAITAGCEAMILVLEGGQTTRVDKLHVLDPVTLESRSVYSFDTHAITAIAVADMDADGLNELVVHHDGKVSTVRGRPFLTGGEPVVAGQCCSFRGMAALQLDADPALEYALAGVADVYLGSIRAFDGATHAAMWTAHMDGGEIPREVASGDLDGDGISDLVTFSVAVHSGAKGEFVYAFSGATGKPLWRSVNIRGSTGRLLVLDRNADGKLEVLALSRTAGIVTLRGTNGAVTAFDEFTGGAAFAAANLDGDPELELIVSGETSLFTLDGGKKTRETLLSDGLGVADIKIADIDGDGVLEVLLARRDSFSGILEVRSATTLASLWVSEPLPGIINFGQEHQIEIADVDNDGRVEVVMLSALTVRTFGVTAPGPDTTAPQFSAGAALQADVNVRESCCTAVDLQWEPAGSDASPPLTYEIFRAGLAPSEPDVLLGTSVRPEFVDAGASGSTRYRYSVRVIDASGNVSSTRLAAEVSIPARTGCRKRRSVRP